MITKRLVERLEKVVMKNTNRLPKVRVVERPSDIEGVVRWVVQESTDDGQTWHDASKD